MPVYSGDLSPRDRVGPALAVILVHIGLGAMLFGMSGHLTPAAIDSALKVINLGNPPPPPPEVPPPPPPKPRENPRLSSAKPRAAAPPAKKAEATPIVLPKPRVVIPVLPTIAVAPKAGEGSAPSQGAASAGTGTGAGGVGSGTGGGGTGTGSGGDGDDGTGTRPRPMFRPLAARGFPRRLVEPLPPGARVLIIFTVEVNGNISGCSVRQPSGSPELDALVCEVATQRFRYDPARRTDGRPYAAKAAYMQVF
ncbi:MAG: energy transducer TonB [Sphingomicrobium sp.]